MHIHSAWTVALLCMSVVGGANAKTKIGGLHKIHSHYTYPKSLTQVVKPADEKPVKPPGAWAPYSKLKDHKGGLQSQSKRRLQDLSDFFEEVDYYYFDYERFNDYFGEVNYASVTQVIQRVLFFEDFTASDISDKKAFKEEICFIFKLLASFAYELSSGPELSYTFEPFCDVVLEQYCEFLLVDIWFEFPGVARDSALFTQAAVEEYLEDAFKESNLLSSLGLPAESPVPPGSTEPIPWPVSTVFAVPVPAIVAKVTFAGIDFDFVNSIGPGRGLGEGELSLCEMAKSSALSVIAASGFQFDYDYSYDGDYEGLGEIMAELSCFEFIDEVTDEGVTIDVHVDVPAPLGFGFLYDLSCDAVEAVSSSLESGIMNHGTFGNWGTGFQVDVGMEMIDRNFDITPGCADRELPQGDDELGSWPGCLGGLFQGGDPDHDAFSDDTRGTIDQHCPFGEYEYLIDYGAPAPGRPCVSFWGIYDLAPMPAPMPTPMPAPMPAPTPAPMPAPMPAPTLAPVPSPEPVARPSPTPAPVPGGDAMAPAPAGDADAPTTDGSYGGYGDSDADGTY